jgi:hypothetical protein
MILAVEVLSDSNIETKRAGVLKALDKLREDISTKDDEMKTFLEQEGSLIVMIQPVNKK